MNEQYFCITIRPLGEFWHGRNEEGGVEYPPSPLRVFQALVAGAYTGAYAQDQPDQKRQALEWLEQQAPPLIVAPPFRELQGFDLYVPNNDADKFPDRAKRLVLKVVRPVWWGEGAVLHYLWRLDTPPDDSVLETLQREVRRLSVLGRGTDWVVSEASMVTDGELPSFLGQKYSPDPSARGVRRLRVPMKGSLESLSRLYAARLKFTEMYEIPDRSALVFREVTYRTDALNDGGQKRPFAAFALVAPDASALEQKRRAFWHTQIARVAAMVRHTAIQAARQSRQSFPGGAERFVAGHASGEDNEPLARFSYLPLPTTNHPYADGGVRRVIIAEPAGGDGRYARWIQRALDVQPLVRERDQRTLAELSSSLSKADENLIDLYTKHTRGARTWLSATPVILPGHDDGKYAKALKLFRKALEDVRISESLVEEVRLQKAPLLPGSAHPLAYFMPEYMRQYSAWHVVIRFTRPFYGPLAIGVGRHIGLGLFAAAD